MQIKIMILALICCFGCKSSNQTAKTTSLVGDFVPDFKPGPHVFVYKTKADYKNLVPVMLSDDKTQIISYPHSEDIKSGEGFAYPTELNGGYLLDNRGINYNSAFLKLSYEEYSRLDTLPSLSELFDSIMDKDPFTELCDCGNKNTFKNIKEQLNILIDSNKLRTVCKVIK